VLSLIAAAEEPGRPECDNATIIEIAGPDLLTLARNREKLWAQDQIEGVRT